MSSGNLFIHHQNSAFGGSLYIRLPADATQHQGSRFVCHAK